MTTNQPTAMAQAGSPTSTDERSLTDLVAAIRSGDRRAWIHLIDRLAPVVERTLAGYRVDHHLRNDAAADAWMALLTGLDDVREPERLTGWISVVARNQIHRLLRLQRRDHLADSLEWVGEAVQPSDPVVEAETRVALHTAIDRLSPREQQVIRCRAYTDQPESLCSIHDRFDIPLGSIGPTLGRSVAKLRRDPALMRELVGSPPSPGVA